MWSSMQNSLSQVRSTELLLAQFTERTSGISAASIVSRTIAELSALDLFEPVDYTQLPDKLEPLRIHSFEYLQSVVDSLN